MAKKFVLLAASFCVVNLYAVFIAPFPGLEKLISRSDAIVVLGIERQLNDVDPNLYATYDCMVYQTLKGEIPTGKTVRFQLMDTRTSFVNPFAVGSAHLMFLTRKRTENEPTEYRTIEIEGANVRVTPFGNERLPEGATIADQIRTLLRRTSQYDRVEFQKGQDFLELIMRKGATPVPKK